MRGTVFLPLGIDEKRSGTMLWVKLILTLEKHVCQSLQDQPVLLTERVERWY